MRHMQIGTGEPTLIAQGASSLPATVAGTADVVLTVPAGHWYRVLAFRAKLVTSAVVQNRNPLVQVQNGSNTAYYESPNAGTAQTASQTVNYTAAADGGGVAGGYYGATLNLAKLVIPVNLILAPGHKLVLHNAGADTTASTGDTWSLATVLVEDFTDIVTAN